MPCLFILLLRLTAIWFQVLRMDKILKYDHPQIRVYVLYKVDVTTEY